MDSGYTLRPVRPEDEPFLLELYATTRDDVLSVVHWDAAERDAFVRFQFRAQTTHYEGQYPGAEYDLVLVDGEPAGRLWVSRSAEEIRLLDVSMLPSLRGRGIGGALMRSLVDEGRRTGRLVRLHVYRDNEGARRLYERCGFTIVGGTGMHYCMEWHPEAVPAQVEPGATEVDHV